VDAIASSAHLGDAPAVAPATEPAGPSEPPIPAEMETFYTFTWAGRGTRRQEHGRGPRREGERDERPQSERPQGERRSPRPDRPAEARGPRPDRGSARAPDGPGAERPGERRAKACGRLRPDRPDRNGPARDSRSPRDKPPAS
jgi:ATP-dependent RNA helicase SUPV3L1/SUV3